MGMGRERLLLRHRLGAHHDLVDGARVPHRAVRRARRLRDRGARVHPTPDEPAWSGSLHRRDTELRLPHGVAGSHGESGPGRRALSGSARRYLLRPDARMVLPGRRLWEADVGPNRSGSYGLWMAVVLCAAAGTVVVNPARTGATPAGPVLVVVAHPDDEALSASGVIEQAVSDGRAVYVAVVTNGDSPTTGSASGYCGAASGTPSTTARYGVTRDRETLAGMGLLGSALVVRSVRVARLLLGLSEPAGDDPVIVDAVHGRSDGTASHLRRRRRREHGDMQRRLSVPTQRLTFALDQLGAQRRSRQSPCAHQTNGHLHALAVRGASRSRRRGQRGHGGRRARRDLRHGARDDDSSAR